jgi:uncharacterized protein
MTEDHCRGFAEAGSQTSATWLTGQGLDAYNEFNDLVLRIIRHPRLKEGFRPDERQLERYLQVLYDHDTLREELNEPPAADEQLLRLACELLENELYPA